MLLSKSDYKLARDCPTKLYYKKKRYASNKDEDPYLKMLAEGGFMIEKMARLLQQGAIELDFDPGDPERSARQTSDYLINNEDITLCEATFISRGKLARVDILRKNGNVIDLVEVKAKSYDSLEDKNARDSGHKNLFRNKNGNIDSKWMSYLEDVTFQAIVLKELYPDCEIRPFLCMPDKAKTTGIDRLYSLFRLDRVSREDDRYTRYEVAFTGDVNQLRSDHFLVEVSVASEVEYLSESVYEKAGQYAASLNPVLQKIVVPLSTACVKCEYRAKKDDPRDGFRECWGRLADAQPHILDLYRAGQISGGNGFNGDDLIADGKVSLFDVTEENLRNKKGVLGSYGKRQLVQIRNTRDKTEWKNDALKSILSAFQYPLHFIDFETTTLAVPYHAGMHPYEPVAFQWSCHTIAAPGQPPVHREWINIDDAFPNFEFARSLMACIGHAGTVFRYAAHESTILRAIRQQMNERGVHDAELAGWLDDIGAEDGIVDMYQDLVLRHYFHPLMKGSNSIKKVVEAIWKINSGLRNQFPEYLQTISGQIASPYEALPPLQIQDRDVVVAEGTGAMRAYEAMMYGLEKDNPDIREKWKQLLLQYCKLDTVAMVMLWMHWTEN
jgi:hypothetical protein